MTLNFFDTHKAGNNKQYYGKVVSLETLTEISIAATEIAEEFDMYDSSDELAARLAIEALNFDNDRRDSFVVSIHNFGPTLKRVIADDGDLIEYVSDGDVTTHWYTRNPEMTESELNAALAEAEMEVSVYEIFTVNADNEPEELLETVYTSEEANRDDTRYLVMERQANDIHADNSTIYRQPTQTV